MADPQAPAINALNRPFWDAASQDILIMPHCIDTGSAFWPPGPISPFTGGAVDWRRVMPIGEMVGLVTYRRAFQAAFADHMPFGIALVALDAGPRLQVHVPDPDGAAVPRPGDRVRIHFRPVFAGGCVLPIAFVA